MSSSDPHTEGGRLQAQAAALRLLLLHLAGRAVRARVDVEDLVQEVFLRALSHPGGLPAEEPGEASLLRFLRHLARNTVVDVARALRARKRDGREDPLVRSDWSRGGVPESQVPGAGPGPLTRLVEDESGRRLERAFRSLSPDHRRVIGLRQLEGLSAAEAGARMGRSEAAVHSLYRRALEAWALAAEEGAAEFPE